MSRGRKDLRDPRVCRVHPAHRGRLVRKGSRVCKALKVPKVSRGRKVRRAICLLL